MYQRSIENSPGIDFNTPALKKHRSLRFFKDHMARWGVAAGGLGVILAILLIFFYLLYEVVPLFKGAELTETSVYPSSSASQGADSLYLSMEEQGEIAMSAGADGSLRFFSTESGEPLKRIDLPVPQGASITSMATDPSGSSLVAAGLSDGGVILFKHDYKITWPDDQRVITPVVSYPYGEQPLSMKSVMAGERAEGVNGAVSQLAISDSDEQLLVAASIQGLPVMTAFTKEEDFLTESVTIEQQTVTLPRVEGGIKRLLIDPEQSWLYIATGPDRLALVNIRDIDRPFIEATADLAEGDARVTDVQFLLGGVSLLVGDSQGQISQWFRVREGESQALRKIRSFQLGSAPIDQIVPEHRRKGFLATDETGQVGLFYTTANRSLLRTSLADGRIDQLSVAPRGNYLMYKSGGNTRFMAMDNEHPEISWSALWGKVWYESYDQPEYIWQSSASNNDFEAKLSLMPLAFGTLKAAFYAMLLATPLAICGAIYTSYFMAPGMRRKVKPVIELMEALPTVILGFLAGLWLAPLIENNLPGIFSLLLFVPAGILVFAFVWDNLPSRIRHLLPDGMQAGLLIPVVLLSAALAMSLNSSLELWLFGGDMRSWLTTELGIPYDQRNALVVGLAMGFAVIPTIFSIAEDAIFSVPKHLSYGSLALGATPWQTLTRVVLLTASPGIFSAVMIGMGRAVGETMIVLMATGNTPIMDANIFEGMRTLAANIAVEMPESEVGSSHYRILFLAALVLFLFTFVVNTAAEMVRHRLRKKYSSL